ncbi:MAG: B12-binding domain-containing radical SAM protein [Deltaproteobacteria bacterium]|nr:MAG: B12-binding domain-containing radical SAM protein [Deltaproteobacteria bacterium]
MVDILLIQPPLADFYHTAKRTIPYGLASIAAAVTRQGYTASILDCLATRKSRPGTLPEGMGHLNRYYGRPDRSPTALFHHFRHYGYSFEHIGRQVKESGAFLVGISSLFTAYSQIALEVARIVKKQLPAATVVLGGHHPTALPEAVMAEPAVDVVLRGEGEDGLPALARALRTGSPLCDVPGIVFRRSDGSLYISDPCVVHDADRLPVPAHDLIRRPFYQRSGRDSVVVTASRGCPMGCSYCATGVQSGLPFRRRSVTAVLQEIRAAARDRRVGLIDFEDENLTMNRSWFMALMDGIRSIFGVDLPELRAMNGLFPPSLTAEVVRVMGSSGFRTLNLSLGSADAAQLKRFNRPDVRAAFDQALGHARDTGMSAVGYIIVGAPEQDPFVSVDDLLFLARRPVLAGVSVYYPAPGSPDYRLCERLGVLPPSFECMRSTALPIRHRTTRTDSVTLLRLGRLLNFIKALMADGLPFPRAVPMARVVDPSLDRQEIGMRIVAAFLADGIIRGVEPDGTVYAHRVSEKLCRRFLDGLRAGSVLAT